ncbi:MAG TPA: VTT domain-containing protein, partial [Longimicrobiales bacterium]|nr:VTT domain-containing protein [Longimicrobiales bacterium]
MSRNSTVRLAIVLGEAALVLSLLAVWLLVEDVRTEGSLTVLFLYSFPSEFLVGLVPHEPVLLFYGQLHAAVTVALVAGVGTTMTEGLNYSFLGFFTELGLFEKAREKALVARLIDLFGRAPFLAVVVAGFTPVPFFPIRFLVVMERYPVSRYLLGVFVSRTPRFFLLAALGHVFRIPGWALLALFAAMIVSLYLPLVRDRSPGATG